MVNLPESKDLGRLLREAHKKCLPTVTLCHGPAALLAAAKDEDMEVPEAIKKYREEHPEEAVPLSGSKRDAEGKNRDDVPLDKNGRPVKVIDDDSEDLDCEFLNNRQAFLNLCRGNHYQFDELRRAKHTSMMVLWHLHNRDAPKFVQQCVACSREILSGKRYHCPSCPDYDLCETCYKDPNVNRGSCTHKLQPIAVESNQEQESSSSGLTEAQRQQRQRNLMLHIQLIEHASRCSSSSCSSTNCAKMKNYLQHSRMCRVSLLLFGLFVKTLNCLLLTRRRFLLFAFSG